MPRQLAPHHLRPARNLPPFTPHPSLQTHPTPQQHQSPQGVSRYTPSPPLIPQELAYHPLCALTDLDTCKCCSLIHS